MLDLFPVAYPCANIPENASAFQEIPFFIIDSSSIYQNRQKCAILPFEIMFKIFYRAFFHKLRKGILKGFLTLFRKKVCKLHFSYYFISFIAKHFKPCIINFENLSIRAYRIISVGCIFIKVTVFFFRFLSCLKKLGPFINKKPHDYRDERSNENNNMKKEFMSRRRMKHVPDYLTFISCIII